MSKCQYQRIGFELSDLLQENKQEAAFVADRAELLLKQAARFNLKTRSQCLEYLGDHFRTALGSPPWQTNYQVGHLFFWVQQQCLSLTHDTQESWTLLVLGSSISKSYQLVCQQCYEAPALALPHKCIQILKVL